MKIKYSEIAAKQLKKINKSNKKNVKMIVESIEKYANNPENNQNIKVLKGKFETFKRLRSGNYRIIFDENDNVMYIYHIKHRKEAYND